MFNLHYSDLSVWLRCDQYNLVSVTLHGPGLTTLPFASMGTLTSRSHSALPIWIFVFFKGIVYNLHWLDRFSPSWFSKRTTWGDMRMAINGFSVVLNQQNLGVGAQ